MKYWGVGPVRNYLPQNIPNQSSLHAMEGHNQFVKKQDGFGIQNNSELHYHSKKCQPPEIAPDHATFAEQNHQ